ncbi:N-acetylneuraminate synthase family protein [bacterium]|nr:N-acetylneuraminate synthase family protein [bacterium]
MTVILDKKILKNYSTPFIAAEVGINHNGSLEKAFKMIDVAKAAGVDAVKFQTFKAREFVTDKKQTYTYYSQGKKVTESMLAMFERYEFNETQWVKIKKKCDKERIYFLSTPQNESDLQVLLKLGIGAIKVGSDDLTNTPLLKAYAKTKLPLILSSGMATFEEVKAALQAVGAFKGYPTIMLACTSEYPTPPSSANLNRIETLMNSFKNIPIGYSDHTEGPIASSVAVALGACFFEKHFTLNHNLPGPDHWFSEDPKGLKEWVTAIRTAHCMLGSGQIVPTKAETKMRKMARRSIVAITPIAKGEKFSLLNIALKRPGDGLPPAILPHLIGKKALKNIKIGAQLKRGDISLR